MSETADALVIFGITGDLARRMTLPALYRLTEDEHLTCTVITVGRRTLGEQEFTTLIHDAVREGVEDVDDKVLSRTSTAMSRTRLSTSG